MGMIRRHFVAPGDEPASVLDKPAASVTDLAWGCSHQAGASDPALDCAFDLFIRLLMPQCFNRVHLCGAAGRKVAENHSDPG